MWIFILLLTLLLGLFFISIGILQELFGPIAEIRFIALTTSIINVIISLIIWIIYDYSYNFFQFVRDNEKVSYSDFYFGLDSISIYFVLITTLITSIALLSNWISIKNAKNNSLSGFVKEQRVDGSLHKLCLRRTLMGFERNYQIKILSKQINKSRFNSSLAFVNSQVKLNPYFVTGFIDAEGCFSIIIWKTPKSKTGWTVQAEFSIGLHKKDLEILELIKSNFGGIGKISLQGKDSIRYRVTSPQGLINVIWPHFEK